jgi:hypothetical protein
MRLRFAVTVIAAICSTVALPRLAVASTYITFNMPGSCSAGVPTGINRWGSVTGYYAPCEEVANSGFLYQSNGTVTTFSAPKARSTYPMGISGTGWIVGYYSDAEGVFHGFLRNPKYTTLDVPGAGTKGDQGTQALSINDAGEISGVYFDSNSVEHGFTRDASGTYTSFDIPGGDGVTGALLNQAGQVAGSYTTQGDVSHGYIMQTDGTITTFDPPNSIGTSVTGINGSGETTGYYSLSGDTVQEFTSDQYGNVTTFNITGFGFNAGIEDNGDVIGSYKNAAIYHGWKRTAAGAVSYFSDPSAAGGLGTFSTCVSGNGKVAGLYYDSSGNQHNFVMLN